jgi:hypothetical protein
MKLNKRLSCWMLILISSTILQACGVYSFTGASLGPDVRTISIQSFYNDSGGGPPNMSQLFTEKIKDYYQQNTNLSLVDDNGDLLVEGSITRYDFTPVAPRASGNEEIGDVAGLMRLSITVNATYINTTDDEFNFDNRSFSFFADFDAEQDPASVEDELIDEILEQIVFDIFTASVANW